MSPWVSALTPPVFSRKVSGPQPPHRVQSHTWRTPGRTYPAQSTEADQRSSVVATFRGGFMSKRALVTGISLALLLAGGVERAEAQQYVSTTAFRVPFTRMDSL